MKLKKPGSQGKGKKGKNMKASEFLKKNYSELTETARNIIETSDQSFDDWAGEFETVDDFNDFAEELSRIED